MAVNLSPVGGVAAQFFTNSGVPLTGGKIFTYAAGTTTPQASYTTSQGNVAWTNPIVLDAAGRVPSGGEIWLTDGLIYKFVLKDANDVLIATYDNITGINSNAVAYTNSQEIQTATAGQTVFTLTTMQYQVGTNSLSVFVDGVNQYGPGAQYAYVETDSTTVTFASGLHVGAEVKFTTTQQQGAGAVDASQVSYTPPFTGSVTTNVEVKLSEIVSVKDFGAVGDGVTDDTAAIQLAFNSGAGEITYPSGHTFRQGEITVPSTVHKISGAGIIKQYSTNSKLFVGTNLTNLTVDGLYLQGNYTYPQASSSSANEGVRFTSCSGIKIVNCTFYTVQSVAIRLIACNDSIISGNKIELCGNGVYLQGCRRINVVSNIIDSTILNDTVFTIGISLESTDGHANGYCIDVNVDNNIVRRYYNAQGIMAHAGTNVTFSNNIVDGPVIGISVNPYNATDDCVQFVISGNNVTCIDTLPGYSGGNDGIILQAGGATPDIADVTIIGNTVVNANRVEKAANQGGIRIGYTKNVTIIGNVIVAAYGYGIVLTEDEDGVSICGNVIKDLSELVDGTLNGLIALGAPKGMISGNTFANINSAVGIGYAIRFDNSCSMYVGDNFFNNVESLGTGFDDSIFNGRVKTFSGTETALELSNVDVVVLGQSAPTTVSSFTGVVPYKTYVFYFTNGNTTIDRTNAYLDGGTNKTGSAFDVMLMMGLSSNKLTQAAPLSVNS